MFATQSFVKLNCQRFLRQHSYEKSNVVPKDKRVLSVTEIEEHDDVQTFKIGKT